MAHIVGHSRKFGPDIARLKEVLMVRKAINAAMVPVDATVRLAGPAIDQLTTLLMPKLTPFVRTVDLHLTVQKVFDAKPDLKAINDATTVIPFEEAQRFTKVGNDSTFLHFALAHGYHRILFDITRVLLDGGFQESLRRTIRSREIIPLSVLSLPNHIGDYLQEDMTDLDIASFPTPNLVNRIANLVSEQFAAIVVATLSAQGKVDETLAYLKDLKEYVESIKANLPANDNAYKWVDSLRAIPFIASAQCGQETAMREFGPLMAKKYHSMSANAVGFGWERAEQAIDNFENYAGPRPSTYVPSSDLSSDHDPNPWYITDRDSDPERLIMDFHNPMISCTEDGKLSFISYGKPRSEV
ncbi:hypothetical protein IWQ60_008691 [Tieghemiomyces parasiticus]|uniref:Uncharacterized protein n=1 Tax=Tieghemiomyces parasiticus TaxID=78921 RepID=A0A9W8DQT4_9FUNG|nr:hypothetical protein IWQ60_008691 [Tieghemiomyces parasiticus]